MASLVNRCARPYENTMRKKKTAAGDLHRRSRLFVKKELPQSFRSRSQMMIKKKYKKKWTKENVGVK